MQFNTLLEGFLQMEKVKDWTDGTSRKGWEEKEK